MDGDEEFFRELKQMVRDTPATESLSAPEDLLDRSAAIPGYELREELYRGGQGIVFRALQQATRREVALKVLLRGRILFEREIDLASRLRHPDIVTIHDSGIADGRPYFAMELVHGRRLDVHLARHAPSLKVRLALFARIAGAVAAAHRRGVIHRDLKPSNILVEDDGRPHILGFGIAMATGELTGSPAYASPEQAQGDPADVDTRSDVYSLGVLLYEMITGRLPYDVSGSLSRTFGPQVDDELFHVLQAALAKDADERYSSADALARDVEHYLAGEPIEVRGRSTWYVLRKSIVRRRVPIAAACLALVVVAAGATLFVREQMRAERQSEHATLVSEIYQDVLGAAAPRRMGSGVTLLEIYEEAAGRMEAALDDAPDAQAEFHFTIGDTYRSLLMWPEAAGHLEQALERYRAVDGAELEVARCLEVYGLVLSELDPPRALPIQREALELRRAALDDGHVDVAASERSLAIALASLYADQDDEGARALLLSALAKHTAALGPRHPEVAATKFWLGRLATRDDRPLDGKRLFEEAVAIFEQADPVDPQLLDALAALASVHRRLDDFEAAQTHLDRAVELTSELYGDERDVEMLRAYANLHLDRGDYVTAERLSRQAVVKELGRWARKRPEDAARIAGVQRRLQITAAAGGEPPYAEAFAILRECRGNGAFELASWANGIARTLLPQERGAATEPLLREALIIRCRAFGMSCPNRVSTLLLLAQVLAHQDRPAEAVPLLEEVLATLERVGEAAGSQGDEARALLERCQALAGAD